MRLLLQGINFCPGQEVPGVTSHDQKEHTLEPIIFHLGKDPGEKYPLRWVARNVQTLLYVQQKCSGQEWARMKNGVSQENE